MRAVRQSGQRVVRRFVLEFFFGKFFDLVNRLSAAVTWFGLAIDHRGRVHVVSGNLFRAVYLF